MQCHGSRILSTGKKCSSVRFCVVGLMTLCGVLPQEHLSDVAAKKKK
jgi:hypothetical protein